MSAISTVLELLQFGCRHLGRHRALALGRCLGEIMAVVARGRRRQALTNMRRALGASHDPAARRALLRQNFRHFGQVLVESLLLPDMVDAGLLNHVQHEGWDHLERATAGGKGAIVFTGHFGSWEVVALSQGARGIPMDVVGRPPDDPRLARHLARLRGMTGNRNITKHDAIRPMLRSLREGRTVGLVIDQNVGAGRGVFVDFFGRPASTTPALALLALKTGVPVLPVFGYPEGDGHRVVYHAPVEVRRTGDRTRDVLDLTARVTMIIEDEVRKTPHLWLWMHNRWRSRPLAPAAGPTGSAGDAPAHPVVKGHER